MKSVICLIIAGCLYHAAGKFNQRFIADTQAAIHAPLRKGDPRPNISLDDPREVAETPEAKEQLAAARSYGTYCKLCFVGSVGFVLLAITIPVLRHYFKEQPCDASAQS